MTDKKENKCKNEDDGNGNGDGGPKDGREYVMKTAPPDPRFPNTNQTFYCYSMYCDFYRCQCLLGEDYGGCDYFKNVFTSLCPNAWVEKWDDQRARGVFPGRIGAFAC